MSEHLGNSGDDIFAICDPMILENYKDRISDGLAGRGSTLEEFQGESSQNGIGSIKEMVEKEGSGLIIGVRPRITFNTLITKTWEGFSWSKSA